MPQFKAVSEWKQTVVRKILHMVNFSFSSSRWGRPTLHLSGSYRRGRAETRSLRLRLSFRVPRLGGVAALWEAPATEDAGPAVLDTSTRVPPAGRLPSTCGALGLHGSTQTGLAGNNRTTSLCSRKNTYVHNVPRSSMSCNKTCQYLNRIVILCFLARTISNACLNPH